MIDIHRMRNYIITRVMQVQCTPKGREKSITEVIGRREGMEIFELIDRAHPKVKPLALALVTAADEQGATVEEFEMACTRIRSILQKKASEILLSELKCET